MAWRQVSDGEVSLTYHSRIVKVIDVMKGEKQTKNTHVAIGRFSGHPAMVIKEGTKLVLFLEPFKANGTLGEATKPFVTIDPWFGAIPYSEALISELKKLSPSEDTHLKDRLDPTPLRHSQIK